MSYPDLRAVQDGPCFESQQVSYNSFPRAELSGSGNVNGDCSAKIVKPKSKLFGLRDRGHLDEENKI